MTEDDLLQLDRLFEHLGEPADDDACLVSEGLTLAAAATEVARLAVGLSQHGSPEQERAGALLAVLDPLALLSYPHLRAGASAIVRGQLEAMDDRTRSTS